MNDTNEVMITKDNDNKNNIIHTKYATENTIKRTMDLIKNHYDNKINKLNRKIAHNERVYKRKMWRKGR